MAKNSSKKESGKKNLINSEAEAKKGGAAIPKKGEKSGKEEKKAKGRSEKVSIPVPEPAPLPAKAMKKEKMPVAMPEPEPPIKAKKLPVYIAPEPPVKAKKLPVYVAPEPPVKAKAVPVAKAPVVKTRPLIVAPAPVVPSPAPTPVARVSAPAPVVPSPAPIPVAQVSAPMVVSEPVAESLPVTPEAELLAKLETLPLVVETAPVVTPAPAPPEQPAPPIASGRLKGAVRISLTTSRKKALPVAPLNVPTPLTTTPPIKKTRVEPTPAPLREVTLETAPGSIPDTIVLGGAPATALVPEIAAPASQASTVADSKRILFITAECTPLAQTGGLGDMVAGLTKALAGRGHDVRIIMPLYQSVDRARHGITFRQACCVHFGGGEEIWIGIYEGKLDGLVPIWFVDYARYFDRASLYGGPEDGFRFGLLSKAALQICKDLDFIPHVAHLHDWMTAPAAVFLKTWDDVLSPLSQTASVLTIHNIGYQGKFDPSVLPFYGFGPEYLSADRFEDFGDANLLKAGIQYADMVTTVSPTYANEIRGPIGGMGLDGYLRNRLDRVTGIINGVDTTIWNPKIDRYLPARYSAENMAGKAACKQALQERFGLTVDPKIPLFGIVSRFAPQKGFDLVRGSLPQALRDMVMQVVVLGSGDPFTENFFRWLSDANPGRANAHIGFDPALSHLIEAGSDFFLMPSIYEPCGLNQLYSSLYGTLPIVRATGGLDDTVDNYDEASGTGTGFKFWELSSRALYFTIGWAVSTWFDRPAHITAMRQQAMAKNFTWDASAQAYEEVYSQAVSHRNPR